MHYKLIRRKKVKYKISIELKIILRAEQMKYEKPTIITYSEDELAGMIGPAQTYISEWEEELG
jgi:hypothetical protein